MRIQTIGKTILLLALAFAISACGEQVMQAQKSYQKSGTSLEDAQTPQLPDVPDQADNIIDEKSVADIEAQLEDIESQLFSLVASGDSIDKVASQALISRDRCNALLDKLKGKKAEIEDGIKRLIMQIDAVLVLLDPNDPVQGPWVDRLQSVRDRLSKINVAKVIAGLQLACSLLP